MINNKIEMIKNKISKQKNDTLDEEKIMNKIKDCYKNLSGYYLKVENVKNAPWGCHDIIFMYSYSDIVYVYNKDKDEYEPIEINTLSAYDYNKHYTSCLMGQDVKFGWPIYNVFDEVKKFDGNFRNWLLFCRNR